jgi:3-isopropylmalate/(R)-2-methylmalate dehydratase small subunit
VEGFTTHTGRIAVYDGDNIDTDRIIPARFLTMVTRSGYGELLFKDVRNADFPLDQPEAQGASILVVGTNFGCGSSREHAVWAIQQAGFKAVIAQKTDTSPGYSDIFRQNAANCGMLLIELVDPAHETLVRAGSGAEVSIDLPNQSVSYKGETFTFDINPASKNAIVKGLDLIGTTLEESDAIAAYERQSHTFVPRPQETANV